MTTVYRIDRQKYLQSVLSGKGAAIYGGRWNHQHVPAVYTSESRSLALLEVLVHLRSTKFIPRDRIIVSIEIPEDSLLSISPEQLPSKWNALPAPHPYTKELFTEQCLRGQYLGLKVPSVVVPQEYNVVLNPNDQRFSESVSVLDTEPLNFDERLGA